VADKRATKLEDVWNNFRPDKALEPDSPFRVERKDYKSNVAPQMLNRASIDECDKWFLVGHRGCGKSTYLRYLLSLPEVTRKFYPVLFRISDVANMADLSYQDVLFAVASKLIEEAENKKAIGKKLKTRLENWGGELVKEITKDESGSAEVEGGLNAVWAKFLLKLQVQHSTRQQFRKTIEPQVSELINIINEVTEALRQKIRKPPLVAIDDIDKAKESFAKEFFGDNWNNAVAPVCHIIYSVPVSLMHEAAWNNFQGKAWYLPNIKLHEKNARDKHNLEPGDGYGLVQSFVSRRMDLSLITEDALQNVITYGAGVFRQTCSLVQTAADRAEYRKGKEINKEDVRAAIAEYADGLRPQLTTKDFGVLKKISQDNTSQIIYEHPKLLHNLTVLLYPNEHHWHDVNPVLWEIIDAFEPEDNNKE
jgi:energy-coupling factor transporter ATP-binding protein EcfA2